MALKDWQSGVIILLQKEGDGAECTNSRDISFLSLPGEVYRWRQTVVCLGFPTPGDKVSFGAPTQHVRSSIDAKNE